MRIGVINWDAGLPSETYFGGYLCPTYGKNGDPDDSLLRDFFKVRSKRRAG